MEQTHDETITWSDVVVTLSDDDLASWKWLPPPHKDSANTTHYYASGPCPVCHAPEQQGTTTDAAEPVESLVDGGVTPAEALVNVEVPVRCSCDSLHGQPTGSGCGRRWSIIGPAASEGQP